MFSSCMKEGSYKFSMLEVLCSYPANSRGAALGLHSVRSCKTRSVAQFYRNFYDPAHRRSGDVASWTYRRGAARTN